MLWPERKCSGFEAAAKGIRTRARSIESDILPPSHCTQQRLVVECSGSVAYGAVIQGAIRVLRKAVAGGRVSDFPGKKKRYEDVRFNVISVMKGWVSNFQKKSVT